MSVYKPSRSPHFHFDFVFKGQRYHGSTNCSSRREAEAYERRERHKAANPDRSRPPITLDEACGLYQDKVESKPSWPTTKYMLRDLIAGLGGNRLLSEISQRELQVHFAKRRNGRADSSINREIDNARSVWSWAAKSRFNVGEVPDWSPLYLSVPETPPRELGETEEQEALFEAIPADAYDVVMFALISGWRKAEVIGLKWSDVNLGRATASTRIKGGNVVSRPLDPSMVALIANQPRVGPFVFTYVCRKSRAKRRAGHRYPMTVTALRTRWEEARDAAKLAGFRFHDLRHTAATRILRATHDLAAVAKVLQHKNLKTTQRYAHVIDQDVRDAISAGQSRIIPERRKSSGSES